MRAWKEWEPPWQAEAKAATRRGRRKAKKRRRREVAAPAKVRSERAAAETTSAQASAARLPSLDDIVRARQDPYDRHQLTISQNDRPPSIDDALPAGQHFGYSTATSMADVKEIRHSRRHLAIHGKKDRLGQRGAAIPRTIDRNNLDSTPDTTTPRTKTDPQTTTMTVVAAAGVEVKKAAKSQTSIAGAPLDPSEDAEHDQYYTKTRRASAPLRPDDIPGTVIKTGAAVHAITRAAAIEYPGCSKTTAAAAMEGNDGPPPLANPVGIP